MPFNIVMDKSEEDPKTVPTKQQEMSTRHRKQSPAKERHPSASKERKKKETKEKPRRKEKSDLTLSGSMDLDYLSSRGMDSFSDSLPRTVPSAEWEEMSQDATFSPIKHFVEGSVHELRKELVTRGTQSELSGNDLRVVGKGMFMSSPKKKRTAAKEEMLYGETSMHVGLTGDGTELDIMMMDETSSSSSRSVQVQQKLGFLCATRNHTLSVS